MVAAGHACVAAARFAEQQQTHWGRLTYSRGAASVRRFRTASTASDATRNGSLSHRPRHAEWRRMGRRVYPDASRLLLTAD